MKISLQSFGRNLIMAYLKPSGLRIQTMSMKENIVKELKVTTLL